MLRVDLEKKFNLKKIKPTKLKDVLNDWAGNIVKDHRRRLQYGQDVDMKPMTKLQASTIHGKRFNNYSKPRVPLYGTGAMSKVYQNKQATTSSPQATIIPPKKRAEIAKYHQGGTSPYIIKAKKGKRLYPLFNNRGEVYSARQVKHPGLPEREWFGITEKQEKKGLRMMEKNIEDQINRA